MLTSMLFKSSSSSAAASSTNAAAAATALLVGRRIASRGYLCASKLTLHKAAVPFGRTATTPLTSIRLCKSIESITIRTFAAAASSESLTGTVKWFDTKKGYGFIAPDDGSEDVFVHQTVIRAEGFRSLAEGEPVEYVCDVDARGRPKASSVTGPMGAFVQGAPQRSFNENSNNRRSYDDRGDYSRRRSSSSSSYSRSRSTDMWDDDLGLDSHRHSDDNGRRRRGMGAPTDFEFHELDMPEDETDDNALGEMEGETKEGREGEGDSKRANH